MDLRSGPVEGRREDREQGGRERGTGQHNGEGGPGPLQVCMCMSDRVGSWPMHGRAHKHTHTHVCTSFSLPMCVCWSMQHRRGRVNLLSGSGCKRRHGVRCSRPEDALAGCRAQLRGARRAVAAEPARCCHHSPGEAGSDPGVPAPAREWCVSSIGAGHASLHPYLCSSTLQG